MKRVTGLVRPAWDLVVAGPVRSGRLRLGGQSQIVRHATLTGLIALIGLLASLLLNDLWRRGQLTLVADFDKTPTFIPLALVPVTLLALALAWTLILWGAAQASAITKVAAAVLFLIVNAALSNAQTISGGSGDPLGISIGPDVARWGYFAAAGLMVVSAVLRHRLRRLVLFGLLVSLAASFGGQLWAFVASRDVGRPAPLPQNLTGAFQGVQTMLLPVLLISVLALVEFSYRTAEALSEPAARWPPMVARIAVAVLIAVKLRVELWRRLGDTTTWARHNPLQFAEAVGSVVFFLAIAAAYARVRRRTTEDESGTEGVLYASTFLFAAPLIFISIWLAAAEFMVQQAKSVTVASFITRNVPSDFVVRWGDLVVWLPVVAAGAFLVVRPGSDRSRRDLGFCLLLVGLWVSAFGLIEALHRSSGFRYEVSDILLTIGAAIYLAVRWPRLSAADAARVGAFVAFTWLFVTRGDFFSRLTGLLTLPSVVVVVFGVLYTLATDSAFATGDSRNFPFAARPLMWVGYLLASVTLTNFLLTTHGSDPTSGFDSRGFHFLAIPFAAWFVIRRRFRPPIPDPPGPAISGGPSAGEVQDHDDGGAPERHVDL
jgi:hypothetical protein